MKKTCLKFRLMAVLLILVLALPVLASAEIEFNQIISFGASLSDPGNAFAITGRHSTPPYDNLDALLVPDAPYAKGGHHFSNGDTWIEQFARNVGLAGDANPAFLWAGTNYAVGGARARDDGKNFNLSHQVSMFLAEFGGYAPPDALYTLEFGGNDIRDFLSNPADLTILPSAIDSIVQNIILLYNHGARKFLVWNSPDVGLTPALAFMDGLYPGAKDAAHDVSFAFNSILEPYLYDLLPAMLPGIEIVVFDSFWMMHELVDHPDSYELVDTENACVQPNSPPFQCKTPDEYLFWDGIHPTKAVHSILAEFAAMSLAGP